MKSHPTITSIREAYVNKQTTPQEVVQEARQRAIDSHEAVWIHKIDGATLNRYVKNLEELDFETSPLWGIPFAIKDNIDLEGVPTTAGCPDFAYEPERSATVVERLITAGAIPIGKTNLDQFATGLTGTRSPYGEVPNAFDQEYISGGSSSGSGVAVATGVVPFALGTDTAGSGRIPAAFNGLVGYKPTVGSWSTRGVVPACRTLDCVSVFTHSVADAHTVAAISEGFDSEEPFSRRIQQSSFDADRPRIGHLNLERADGICSAVYTDLYDEFLASLSDSKTPVDPSPLLSAGKLLYEGPWLAERVVAVGQFIENHSDSVHPVTRSVIGNADNHDAVDCFESIYALQGLKREVDNIFDEIDVLVTPTSPTHYTRLEVASAPIDSNTHLGTFTNCVNLLDLCAVAIPAAETQRGLPFGVTLLAQAGRDHALLKAAADLLGEKASDEKELANHMHLVVCGAHMSGQPLNHDLTHRGARQVALTRTSSNYQFFALPDGKRPALIRTEADGAAIEVEVWSMPQHEVGGFLATVGSPLAIGSVELKDGRWVHGFVGDASAAESARNITEFGGWRRYREAIS